MRYIEINEGTKSGDALTEILTRDCQSFLQSIDNDLHGYRMYRGMSRQIKTYTSVKSRLNNRQPNATDPVKHDQVNDYFHRAFGQPYRNAVFTSGNSEQARAYGYVHIIVPIGDFSFLWASDVNDMAITLAGRWPSAGGFSIPPKQKQTDELLSRYDYTTKDLKSAIKSKQEIMIWAERYYAIDLRLFSDVGR